ncbi:MAG: hypothetical protein DID90_2727552872 [Candidatus Nitrotoga sp. LAW]|nr:MAG: hypothetical protein DID90_2727552872 [Candidatus Nitrotoga sp. LAW]
MKALVHYDYEAVIAGFCKRTNLTGLMVSVGGKLMACVEWSDFNVGMTKKQRICALVFE